MTQLYRLCWRNKDFPESSKGPPLVHLDRRNGKKKEPFTKDEAVALKDHYNLKHNKGNKIRFWIEEVGKKDGNN